MLKRSSDRKVANTPKNSIRNAFGLPAGRAFSCPGATSVCEKVCYAEKIENRWTNVSATMRHNWDILSNASWSTMVRELHAMISEFEAECEKKNAEKAFRIHWDGDFFSREYASAWAMVVKLHPMTQFWVYTRSFTNRLNVIDIIADIDNLSVYLSVDSENELWAPVILAEYPNVKIAALAPTFADAANVISAIRIDTKPGAKCPELTGALPLISEKGGACFACQLCPKGKADIRFSSTVKNGVRV
jgi:hypothetical protein